MKKINVRNIVIGEGKAKICVPVVGRNELEVLEQTRSVADLNPDIIEWRCDILDVVTATLVISILKKMRDIIGDIPLLFTFRTDAEGGEKHISDKEYVSVNLLAASTGNVDLIDIEAYSKSHLASTLIREIHANGAKVVASNHNFDKTPSQDIIVSILKIMEKYDPDICKMAVMPHEKNDVTTLIEASIRADESLKVPVITMSMGELGCVTRVCTEKTKSCVTFASGSQASAPGQLPCAMLREIYELADEIDVDKNLMLIGFMGTGKSTVSAALHLITGMEEVDVDNYIVETRKKSISDIFAEKGEEGFRDIETKAIKELQQKKGRIISCGGGAVLKDENVNIMKDGGVILLLTATPEVVFDRVKNNTGRPILNEDMSIEHVIELMNARRDKYEQAADITIDTDHSDRVRTCYSILKALSQYN